MASQSGKSRSGTASGPAPNKEKKGLAETVGRQRRHYETVAQTYVESRQAHPYSTFYVVWAERLLSPWLERYPAEVRRNQVVVDPMCGHANLAPFILRHTEKLVLNDLSPKMLAYIDEEIKGRCRVLPAGDAAHLSLENESVDVVVVSGGLHHARATLPAVLLEFWRVLRPGGLLVFGEPSDDFLPVRAARRLFYSLSRKFEQETEQAFRHSEIRTALAEAGFGDVQLSPLGSIGYLLMAQVGVIPILRRSKSRWLFRFLLAVDRVIEGNALTRRACVAFTGAAVKQAEQTS